MPKLMTCQSCGKVGKPDDLFYWRMDVGSYRQPCKECCSVAANHNAYKYVTLKRMKIYTCPYCGGRKRVPLHRRENIACDECSKIEHQKDKRTMVVDSIHNLAIKIEITPELQLRITDYIIRISQL